MFYALLCKIIYPTAEHQCHGYFVKINLSVFQKSKFTTYFV